jgi:PGF-pre-PGF domain-containing protein
VGISTIQIVPKKSIGSTQVFVRDTNTKDVLKVTGRPVAGISEIQLSGVNPSSIDHAVILFALSGAWMRKNDLTPADVVMLRDSNAQWTELPTRFDHLDGDTYYFSATTPGFSYFAVAGRVPAAVDATAVPTLAAADSTAQPLATPTLAAKPTTKSTTSVPVAMQAAPESAPQPSAAKGWNPLIVAGAVVAGIVLVSVSVVTFLKRRRRKRDPLR